MPALALIALLVLTCARAEIYKNNDAALREARLSRRSVDANGAVRGCIYSGRWFAEGAVVHVRDACLRCTCAHGALSCARATCASAPDPPPHRCAQLHRRSACCPELHCPDGVKSLELEASARKEDDTWDVATPTAPGHACVEDGAIFAAGSALSARVACEQCFCLRGAKRCVRPRCLPPPPGCSARPAPGACCPARYYCDPVSPTTLAPPVSPTTPSVHNDYDCDVDGKWVPEGESVRAASVDKCVQCFCLRGDVHCQALDCAPALRGCTPLLRPGQCCPHQYRCPHRDPVMVLAAIPAMSSNALMLSRSDERSFRSSASPTSVTAATLSDHPPLSAFVAAQSTIKVKRKTSDPTPDSKSHQQSLNMTKVTDIDSKETEEPTTAGMTKSESSTESSTSAQILEQRTTDQAEGSVKIMVNGTINCTAELSSTFINTTRVNGTDKINGTSTARVPAEDAVEVSEGGAMDIITESSAALGDGDIFTINVTSSLRANTSAPAAPATAPPSPTPSHPKHSLNISKKTKEDYDYDYMEPTLPPSLPNLKIIPFVAADAVVDKDVPSKDETLNYPVLEREDKFPVYFANAKETQFATRREDVYSATQYPVFNAESAGFDQFSEPMEEKKAVSVPAGSSSTHEHVVPTPGDNLFSPPVETEGGFIPKGPGPIDEYFAVFPSTPPPVPHLTTSMQINPATPDDGECVTGDGRHVAEGDSVWLACSVCACAWGELHCSPRRCHSPPGCHRRPAAASSADLCCGELVCDNDIVTTTPVSSISTRNTEITLNVTKVPTIIETDRIPFDPPPDRSVPTEGSNDSQQTHLDHRTATTSGVMHVNSPEDSINETFSNGTTRGATTPTTPASTHYTQPSFIGLTTEQVPGPSRNQSNHTDTQSAEYEDEEDDEGFSFGSVLKLLLSDSYDTTTAAPNRKKPTVPPARLTTVSAVRPYTTFVTTRIPTLKPTAAPFLPLQHHQYLPPKKVLSQNTLNRIDHLVLGEATAIKKTTARPAAVSSRPSSTPLKRFTTQAFSRAPPVTRPPTTRVEEPLELHSSAPIAKTTHPAGFGGGAGAGLLKLAGCNIYGRMYRVGRIIAELSTPCQECRCTELGVQCAPLRC